MTEAGRYPLLRKENIPAYLTVLAVWIVFSLVSAAGLKLILAPTLTWPFALGWALVTAMGGMAIMFGASALNLRTLRAGFARLSKGEPDPQITPVWCPVYRSHALTSSGFGILPDNLMTPSMATAGVAITPAAAIAG